MLLIDFFFVAGHELETLFYAAFDNGRPLLCSVYGRRHGATTTLDSQ
jgi:hypothetical protein